MAEESIAEKRGLGGPLHEEAARASRKDSIRVIKQIREGGSKEGVDGKQEQPQGRVLKLTKRILTATGVSGMVALLGAKLYLEYGSLSLSGPVVTTDESPPSAVLDQKPEIFSPQPPPAGGYDREVSPDLLPGAEEASQPEEVIPPTVYRVQPGDSLWKISQEYGTPAEIIRGMNSEVVGDDGLIHPGDELLIAYWGPVEQSHYLAEKKAAAVCEKGGKLSWVYLTLDREASALELADSFGTDSQELVELNEIENPEALLPKGYYLMIPFGEGFAFTERDREAGRRWVPVSGLSMDRIWWVNPREGPVGPWWPCEAKVMMPVQVEYQYGDEKITHTEFEAVPAGEWILPPTYD